MRYLAGALRGDGKPWFILCVFAFVLSIGWRAHNLENRPLHADEAVQAWLTLNLLRGEGYSYDPVDRHGPFLYYGSALYHRILGGSAEDFDDRACRSFSLLAAIATLVIVWLGPKYTKLGSLTGGFALLLMAFETFTSVYHTYFIQEAWLAVFVWLFFLFVLRCVSVGRRSGDSRVWVGDKRSIVRPFGIGVIAGLAQTCKEISPLYLLLALLSIWLSVRPRLSIPKLSTVISILAGFAIPFAFLYSSFGNNARGIVDSFGAYGIQITRISDESHSYPWWHYFELFSSFKNNGINWGQSLLLLFSLFGCVVAFSSKANQSGRALSVFTVSLFVIHLLIPYKTPWLLLTPAIGLVLLAGLALDYLVCYRKNAIWVSLVLCFLASYQSFGKSYLALVQYPGDVRNPYFYEQTPRGFMRILDRIGNLGANFDRPLNIAVVSEESAWPLPWYLRGSSTVGYFEKMPNDFQKWDLLVIDSQLGDASAETMENRVVEYVAIRPNVLLQVLISESVWEESLSPEK
ncbi:hypothetical protein MLD52_06070 [Puniceicoccaceae bacterium K14]|nr:hypothetical protein [Puniceicoccaceae bacterium K14]